MRPLPTVAGVILAAGEARRMGRSKLLLPFQGSTILGSVVRAARNSPLAPVVLVLGHDGKRIEAQVDLNQVIRVLNPDYRNGQSSSLKAGLGPVPPTCQGAMFLLGDQPCITPGVIETLLGRFTPRRDRLVIPTCKGRRGNPVIVHRDLFPEIIKLQGDVGARPLFRKFNRQIRWVEFSDPRLFLDVDTAGDYQRLVGVLDQIEKAGGEEEK